MATSSEPMTDRQLLLAYCEGRNVHAFGTFVERHESDLLSFAASFLRDDNLAQDVVQEAFFKAARDPRRVLKNVEAGGSERHWMLKVVRDLAVDRMRRTTVDRKARQRWAERAADRDTARPDDELLKRERIDRATAAVDRLHPRYRELVILKVREGMSYKDMARVTGLSVTNVGFLLHKAMKALAAELKE